jgi:PleD family two-component response regulator
VSGAELGASIRPVLLVVDDHPANVQILHAVLRGDYEVCVALSGKAALAFCNDRIPDLILLDVVMPEMDGYQLCAALKASAHTRDIPIVFVTGNGEPQEQARGYDAGGVDVIVKPFHATVVRARVRAQLTLVRQARLLRALGHVERA